MDSISVVLADDHPVIRTGIKFLISDSNIDVIGEASDGAEAIEKVEELSPDVLITDISMPEKNGIEVTQIVSENYPNTKVIVYSMHYDEEYIIHSFRNGAMSYLLKDSDLTEIIESVRSAKEGRRFINSSVREILSKHQGESEEISALLGDVALAN